MSELRNMRLSPLVALAFGLLLGEQAPAQVIDYYEGKLDCDTAYTTLEMGWCSKHLLDSSTFRMNRLVADMEAMVETELIEVNMDLSTSSDTGGVEFLRSEVLRLTALQNELRSSQTTFLAYAARCREVVGEMMGLGRERVIQENMTEYGLVLERIKVLEGWLQFY